MRRSSHNLLLKTLSKFYFYVGWIEGFIRATYEFLFWDRCFAKIKAYQKTCCELGPSDCNHEAISLILVEYLEGIWWDLVGLVKACNVLVTSNRFAWCRRNCSPWTQWSHLFALLPRRSMRAEVVKPLKTDETESGLQSFNCFSPHPALEQQSC